MIPKNVKCKFCMHYKHEWCSPKLDSPDPDRVRDCVYFKHATNADRIRAMTDEELAEFIARQRFSTINPIADELGIDVTLQFIEGRKNALDWLKQEVDNERLH